MRKLFGAVAVAVALAVAAPAHAASAEAEAAFAEISGAPQIVVCFPKCAWYEACVCEREGNGLLCYCIVLGE